MILCLVNDLYGEYFISLKKIDADYVLNDFITKMSVYVLVYQ